jgi:hypothetical protein
MKKILFFTILGIVIANLFSGVIITRNEMGYISKEIYADNKFAEVQNDMIVSIWDFTKNELTLVDHYLGIYTSIDFASFKTEMEKQNQAQIQSQLRSMDEEHRQMLAAATNNLFRTMFARFMIVDTLHIAGYKTWEYHVYNNHAIVQKIWISKSLQEKIDEQVDPLKIAEVEKIFKNNRENYLAALGIELDPVTRQVESIGNVGYVMRRIDYGLRERPNPEFEREMEDNASYIENVSLWEVDPAIFTAHQNYRRLRYIDYQIAIMRAYENE